LIGSIQIPVEIHVKCYQTLPLRANPKSNRHCGTEWGWLVRLTPN